MGDGEIPEKGFLVRGSQPKHAQVYQTTMFQDAERGREKCFEVGAGGQKGWRLAGVRLGPKSALALSRIPIRLIRSSQCHG